MIHWLMLHTKYQGSRPSDFKQDDLFMLTICQCKLCDEVILTTAPQFKQTWKSTTHVKVMLHTKFQNFGHFVFWQEYL